MVRPLAIVWLPWVVRTLTIAGLAWSLTIAGLGRLLGRNLRTRRLWHRQLRAAARLRSMGDGRQPQRGYDRRRTREPHNRARFNLSPSFLA